MTKSILRYPGGKSRAVNYILNYIPKGTKELCSPFFGGGSVEFACASNSIVVYGYDSFNHLINFWKKAFTVPNELADVVDNFFPLNKELFYALQKQEYDLADEIKMAAIFYVLNRASFSGSTFSGGMSPNHPRFNKQSIDRLRNFKVDNINIECLDFADSIKRHDDVFLYLDPPYMIESSLYGINGNSHKNFPHEKLFDLLKGRSNWMLSYNNNPKILEYYKNYEIVFPNWKYGMGNIKESKEVLILNL